MKHGRLWLLAAAFAAQLSVPAWTIVDREITLARGESFRFRTTVVDPYDAFRGRYVRVAIADDTVQVEDATLFERPSTAYAAIVLDENGYARFDAVTLEPPESGPYMKVRTSGAGGGGVRLRPPFDRYYMNERLAPEAERVYRDHSGAGGDAYLDVAVRGGNAVIEGLYIEGEPIEAYVRRLTDR